jgi:hypothetical protein
MEKAVVKARLGGAEAPVHLATPFLYVVNRKVPS